MNLMEKMVPLSSFAGQFQCSLVEGILKAASIPAVVQNTSGASVALGIQSSDGFLGDWVFLVPEDRLQEAKDLLCANGVVCEVSERILRRCLEEYVKPLLENPERDLGQLIRMVAINNKETVRALFDATLAEEKGRGLLVDLFFALALEGSPGLRNLARALQKRMDDDFGERFLSEAVKGEKTVRLSLIDIIPELPVTHWRLEALTAALLDEDVEIRDAGSEALYAMGGNDYGYDPEAASEEREAAIERMLGESGFH